MMLQEINLCLIWITGLFITFLGIILFLPFFLVYLLIEKILRFIFL